MTDIAIPATEPRTVDERAFCEAMGKLAKCVAVTTALGPAGPLGCTTTSMISLSVRPPSVLLSFGTGSSTLSELRMAGRFAVNMLSYRQRDLVARFAHGSHGDRFRDVRYRVEHGVPIVTGSSATIICELDRTIGVLDHTLVVGTVRALRGCSDGPLVLVDGRPHPGFEHLPPPAPAVRPRPLSHPPETP